jgi:hypothetical protein
MRVFKKYAPRQIAKYVVSFFKGKFQIEGAGVFEFDAGKVVFTVQMDPEKIKICKEINDQVCSMSNRLEVEQYTY